MYSQQLGVPEGQIQVVRGDWYPNLHAAKGGDREETESEPTVQEGERRNKKRKANTIMTPSLHLFFFHYHRNHSRKKIKMYPQGGSWEKKNLERRGVLSQSAKKAPPNSGAPSCTVREWPLWLFNCCSYGTAGR